MQQIDIGFQIPQSVQEILAACPKYTVASNRQQLFELATRDAVNGVHEVAYDVPGRGRVVEATVCRVKNGIAANYVEPYMRRRDPDCMLIADDLPTDKLRFEDEFGESFDALRAETFAWLKTQELALFPFIAGAPGIGADALVVAPANAGFFALGLALLQGILDGDAISPDFDPKAVIFVAPPFRHTHFKGKQMVVHNRRPGRHELFSYNLYPGPSAKKGIYGVLLTLGEREDWLTAHCAAVQVITPYANKLCIMHEGASGGGKSELLEQVHRQSDGGLLLGVNTQSGEQRTLVLPANCELRPVTDDMALCHPSLAKNDGRLALMDAENGWFVRVNHITHYGTDPNLEQMTIHPTEPLLFLNIEAQPGSTALIWEHIEDAPGKPCPNPRVVIPRKAVPNIHQGAVNIDVRSFGVRCPPCTSENPTYGIMGLFHLLPPALAWLWRLVAPRGHANPSIVSVEGMSSEGVGSYWPFATGLKVTQANLLLEQIMSAPKTTNVLIPNQHIGAYHVGFMGEWLSREYLARHNGFVREKHLVPARCPLFGYALDEMKLDSQFIRQTFLRPETQSKLGNAGYDAGAKILTDFFKEQLQQFISDDLDPLGREIIDCCLHDGTLDDYLQLTPMKLK